LPELWLKKPFTRTIKTITIYNGLHKKLFSR